MSKTKKDKNKINIFVIGSQKGYASWMEGNLVENIEEADLVWLTGGEDINPNIYNNNRGSRTHFNDKRDTLEIEYTHKAVKLGLPIFGTCRGAQMLCALAGGTLVQDMSHPYAHTIKFWDGTIVETNSLHHQLQFPFCMKSNKYKVLAWAEGLSNYHLNGSDQKMLLPTEKDNDNIIMEPELVYYKELNALGIQGHPEMMSTNSQLVKILKMLTYRLINNTLEEVINKGTELSKLMIFDDDLEEELTTVDSSEFYMHDIWD